MELANTYSKRWAGFDVRYWITLATLILLSVLGWGFKKKFIYSCPVQTIPMQGVSAKNSLVKQSFLMNETIVFSVPETDYKSVEWFIDNDLKSKDAKFTHAFAAAGKYAVKLKIDGKCEYIQIVNVLPYKHQTMDISLADAGALPDMVIEGNETFEAGTITYFTTPVVANAYEWQILEVPEYGIKNEQLVGYSIISAGTYTLQLKLNNDDKKVFTKVIKVTAPVVAAESSDEMDVPKPIDMPPANGGGAAGGGAESGGGNAGGAAAGGGAKDVAKPKNVLPDSEILSMLRLIREEKKTVGDLAESLCDGEKTKVLANDDKVMTLGELAERLQSKKWALGKRPKVNSVRTVRDDSDGNCVSVIYVSYK